MNIFSIDPKFGNSYSGNMAVVGKVPMARNIFGLKSTREKLERQQNANSQIQFWENQKENLKHMKCDSLEDIARKLELFHGYEDEIAVVMKLYNNEQMWHAMDEAREMGEKIAEIIEKTEPKTLEERKEETVKETLGIEKGILSEILDDMLDGILETREEVLGKSMEEAVDKDVEFGEAVKLSQINTRQEHLQKECC